MKNKLVRWAIIALAVGLVGGYFLGYWNGNSEAVAAQSREIAAVKKILPSAQSSVTTLNGTVQTVTASGITLQVTAVPPFLYPLVDTFPLVRTVTVTSGTKIMFIDQKSVAEFQSETAAYQEQAQKYFAAIASSGSKHVAAPPAPPVSFSEATGTLSDLKAGESVTVMAGSDIASSSSFSATEIDVSSSSAQ